METTYLLLMFFIALAGGAFIGVEIKPNAPGKFMEKALRIKKFFRTYLGKFCGTLIIAIVIGSIFYKCSPLNIPQLEMLGKNIDFLKSLMFLLFIFATGYQIGPNVRKIDKNSWRGGVFPLILAIIAVGVIWGISFSGKLSIYKLIGVSAGGVTQTATMGVAEKSLKNNQKQAATDIELSPEQIAAQEKARSETAVSFAICYLLSTIITMFICCACAKSVISKGKKQSGGPISVSKQKISSKELLMMERQGRAFRVAGSKKMPDFDVLKEKLFPLTIQGIIRGDEVLKITDSITLSPGDLLILLGDREDMKKAESLIGPEEYIFPESFQKNFKYESMSIRIMKNFHKVSVSEFYQESIKIIPDLYIEQITRNGESIDWKNPQTELAAGDQVKLFCRKDETGKLDGRVGMLFPKKKETDILWLSFGIAVGIAFALIPRNIFGDSLCTFFCGILVGKLRSKRPRWAGFPPQASQLFIDFGLMGVMALTGISAAKALKFEAAFWSGLLWPIVAGLLIIVIPLGIAWLLGRIWIYKNDLYKLPFALAGSRSANPALMAVQKEFDSAGKNGINGKLMSEFTLTYTIANILLTMIGLLFGFLFQ